MRRAPYVVYGAYAEERTCDCGHAVALHDEFGCAAWLRAFPVGTARAPRIRGTRRSCAYCGCGAARAAIEAATDRDERAR